MAKADEIEKLVALKEKGALTQEEFESAKRELLSSPKKTRTLGTAIKVLLAIGLLIVVGSIWYYNIATNGTGIPASTSAPSRTESAATPSTTQVKDHWYAVKQGYRYGYQKAISKKDKDSGVAVNELVFISYTGKVNGLHQFFVNESANTLSWLESYEKRVEYIECSEPCNIVTTKGYVSNLETVPTGQDSYTHETYYEKKPIVTPLKEKSFVVTEGSLVNAIVQDILAGKLDRIILKNSQDSDVFIRFEGNSFSMIPTSQK